MKDGALRISKPLAALSISLRETPTSSLMSSSIKVRIIDIQIFYLDKINIFELYNGLLKANAAKPELGLDQTVKHVESQYKDYLKKN